MLTLMLASSHTFAKWFLEHSKRNAGYLGRCNLARVHLMLTACDTIKLTLFAFMSTFTEPNTYKLLTSRTINAYMANYGRK